MKSQFPKLPRLFVTVGGFALVAALMFQPAPVYPQQPAPDNTRQNADQRSPNADQQGMNASDRAITQKIRKAIHEDKNLSTYAHNIKVITRNGKVTLRGPVRSEDEKNSLEAKAVSVVSQENVVNQLQVAPSK
jgi:osmotically-inducible protein OsmY